MTSSSRPEEDRKRRAHIVHVTSLKRIATFKVVSWRGEDSFTIVQGISTNTPVEYHQADLPLSDVTRNLVLKTAQTTTDGCHLGYDRKRRAHIVYVPSLKRIATFKVVSWRGKDSFTIVKGISTDTPVEYHLWLAQDLDGVLHVVGDEEVLVNSVPRCLAP